MPRSLPGYDVLVYASKISSTGGASSNKVYTNTHAQTSSLSYYTPCSLSLSLCLSVSLSLSLSLSLSPSCQVQISPIAQIQRDTPRYHGNLIASNSQYYAYVVSSRHGYTIRVIQRATKNKALLKNFVGQVVDLSFAHSGSNKLAAVDQAGNVYYYDLEQANGDVEQIEKYVCLIFLCCVHVHWAS